MNIVVERLGGGTLGTRWTPKVGPFTKEFIDRKLKQRSAPDADAMERVVAEAATILGRCVPPSESAGQDAGLVVGYVQSGKTLSFTTVTALARDNGYGVVILLAGTAVALKGQSEDRLTIDLGMSEIQHDWRKFENPDVKAGHSDDIEKVLRAWSGSRGGAPGTAKRSILITVLKHHKRLENLREVLERVNLTGIPVLIIDDESDQAGLNAKAGKNLKTGSNELSSTYQRILELKEVIPHHTYLQYTATPQANLLIAVADVLSPSFAELVSPGAGYVGGGDFFSEAKPLCFEIPLQEVPTVQNSLTEAPQTLQQALQLFILGAAHHSVTRGKGNRSMMVHPSQRTAPHTDYKEWLDRLLEHWRDFLEQPRGSAVRKEIERSLRENYAELLRTFPELEPFDKLVDALPEVFSELKVVKVNSNADGQKAVKWNDWPYWILVGGQKLDRGFTVEGLTISYMPRTASTNADTLQQRARFFGYKRSYEGLCRVFLLDDVIDAFENYVESEEFVRNALAEHRGKPLQEWKRDFILNRALSPTRKAVIGRSVVPVEMDEGWVVPGSLYFDAEAVLHNRQLFERKAALWKQAYGAIDAAQRPQFKDVRRDSSRNILIEGVSINDVLDFLLDIRIRSLDDSTRITAAAISLVKHREDAEMPPLVDVILIGGLSTDGLIGRSLTAAGKINNLFVGESPKGATSIDQLNYVGDRALFTPGRITLHLRYLVFKPDARIDSSVTNCVPWFSIHLPESVAKDCVIEEL
ncbi:Z1 domain-containing protein [Delftia acidovorans]|uniref:Z1 domain-containing protein n=1 Tax=Delftia acidovorans TaxID=80866 RepID=UPI001EFCF554|nr:Z1 domain-containing protein [Delftia acidovorans]MCG8988824.1 Z1 domain-containing protein [Delftia acidovorans]